MFPLRDHNRARRRPYVTGALIAANLLAWAGIQGLGTGAALTRSICSLGLIPGALLGTVDPGTAVDLGVGTCVLGAPADAWITPLSSMFLHGSWMHLIGNLWFLWIFGDNVEDELGHARYLLFYLVCGLAAAAAQVASHPASEVPMVGASGAIGGVMGAYALLHPRARVDLLMVFGFFVRVVPVPAVFMLGYWLLIQVVSGSLSGVEAGVAFWAHVGGFAAGAALAYPLRRRPRSRVAPRR